MKLSRFTIIAGTAMALAAGGVAVYNRVTSDTDSQSSAQIIDQAFEELAASRDLTASVKDVQFDIVQVQQWLTDISATRGLDGLNDGPQMAEEFAQKFSEDAAKAKAIALLHGQQVHRRGP